MAVQRRLGPVALLLVAALATACGSTVQGTETVAVGGGAAGGDGLGGPGQAGAPQSTGPGLGGTGGSAGGSSTTGSTGGTTGVPIGSGGTTGGTGGATGGVTGSAISGPGVTAKEVYVGLVYDKNAGAVNKAAGAGKLTAGDSKADQTAIIDDINKHGGVGGRKLVPVYANVDSESTQTIDQQYAAVCQQFTQDNPRVFAVEGGVGESEAYRACLSKGGVVMLDDDLPRLGQAEMTRYPGLIEQGYPNVDRLAAYHVTPLVEQHYFTPWNTVTGQPAATGAVKVGILTYDDRVFSTAVDRLLVPALKRLGYNPLVKKIAQNTTAGDISSQAAAVQNAELSFAQNGVTHVIPFESDASLSQFFLAAARTQNYYPRYGISTASAFQALLDAGIMDKKQATGTVGYGWLPNLDLPPKYNADNGPYSNASRRNCAKVMREKGIAFDSSNAQGIAFLSCTSLYLLKAALDKTPAQINLSTFLRAVESLGTSYQPAGGLGPVGQEFKPGVHDPPNKAYHWRYYEDCTCFHYEGAIRTVP